MYAALRTQGIAGIALLFLGTIAAAVCAQDAASFESGAQFRVAAEHYARGRWDLAIGEFGTFLERYPNDAQAATAQFFLGEAQVQLGKHREARDTFAAYLEAHPSGAYAKQALFRQGESAYLAGQLNEARADLRRFLAAHPQDALAAYGLAYLGEATLATGDAPAAAEAFQKSLRQFPGGPLEMESRFGLGRALQRSGEADAAIAQYEVVAGKDHQLAAEARLRAAQLNYAAGRHDDVFRLLANFSTRYAESEFRFEAAYCLAMSQIGRGQWRQAETELRKLTSQLPRHRLAPAAGYYLGETLRQQDRSAEAEAQFRAVRKDWPNSNWANRSNARLMLLALAAEKHEEIDRLAATAGQGSGAAHQTIALMHARSLIAREDHARAAALLEPLLAIEREAAAGSVEEGEAGTEQPPAKEEIRYYLALTQIGQAEFVAALATLEEIDAENAPADLLAGIAGARATALLNLQRYEEAIPALRQRLKHGGNGDDAAKARANLALALAQAGKLKEARAALEEYAEQNPKDARLTRTRLFLAEIAHSAGDHAWAKQLYEQVEAAGGDDALAAQARAGLAWSQFESGNKNDSAETFERLMRDFPESPLVPQAALARGKSLEEAGQARQALEMYTLVVEKFNESPEHADALLAAARVHTQLKQLSEAHAALEQIAREHPELPRIDAVHYQNAWVLSDMQQPEKAEELFTKIYLDFRKSPYWADAAYRLAEKAVRRRDYERANQLAAEIAAKPEAGEVAAHALYLRGQLAATADQWEAAGAEMRTLLERFPESSLALTAKYWVAESLYRREMYEEAGTQLEALAAELGDAQEAWLGMIPLRRAQVLAHQENWSEARELAAGIAAAYPGFTQQYEADYLLGRCHAARAEFTEARAAYERAIGSPHGRSTETAAMAQWMIGESYLHQKQYEQALQAYHRTEILYRAFPKWQAAALLQAGKCYESLGRWGQVTQQYARILQEFADSGFAEEAGSRLRAAQQRVSQNQRSENR